MPLSDLQFKVGYYYVTHKAKLKRGLIITLVALDIFLILFSGIKFLFYELGREQHNLFLAGLTTSNIDYAGLRAKNKPSALIVESVAIIRNGNKSDLIARAFNPNQIWAVESLKYNFLVDGISRGQGETYFLPQEEKYLFAFNLSGAIRPSGANLELFEINWQRIKGEKSVEAPNFGISEIQFLSADENFPDYTRLSFKVQNLTPYNFWSVSFPVLILRGQRVIAANIASKEQFFSGSAHTLEVSWPFYVSQGKVLIYPEVNIFDPAVIMPQ